jgi:integrase
MPRRRSSVPSYRRHKQSGQAIVTLTDAPRGRRRDVLLGPHGTPESRAEYARVLADWEARNRSLPPTPTPSGGAPTDLTVAELLLAFWRFAESHYRHPDGTPTGELANLRHALRPLRELYGHTPAAKFDGPALKALRQRLVDRGLSRGVVNQRVGIVRRVFRWAVGEALLPAAVHQALAAVDGLKRGRSGAREAEPVGPVEGRHVEAVLPRVLPPVRAMIEFQRLTGCRPGEAVRLRADLIDRPGPLWYYRPRRHKTAHKGRGRVVVIGPRAQALLAPFLAEAGADGHLFSPRRAVQARRAELRSARKTPVQPSQQNRARRRPLRGPGDRYSVVSYAKAVSRACEAAAVADLTQRRPELLGPVRVAEAAYRTARNAWRKADRIAKRLLRERLRHAERAYREAVAAAAEAGDSVRHWHPNQLRHGHGTEVRRRYGLEGAQVALGHSKADVTQVYAERDLALAERIAREVG